MPKVSPSNFWGGQIFTGFQIFEGNIGLRKFFRDRQTGRHLRKDLDLTWTHHISKLTQQRGHRLNAIKSLAVVMEMLITGWNNDFEKHRQAVFQGLSTNYTLRTEEQRNGAWAIDLVGYGHPSRIHINYKYKYSTFT